MHNAIFEFQLQIFYALIKIRSLLMLHDMLGHKYPMHSVEPINGVLKYSSASLIFLDAKSGKANKIIFAYLRNR